MARMIAADWEPCQYFFHMPDIDMRRAFDWARDQIRSGQEFADADWGWDVRVARLTILSRRRGLAKPEFHEFDGLVRSNMEAVKALHWRWKTSLAEVYAECPHGDVAALAISWAVMFDRMKNLATDPGELDMAFNILGQDTVANNLRRLGERASPVVRELSESIWESLRHEPGSSVHRLHAESRLLDPAPRER